MSRKADRRFNNRTNRVSNNRVYNAAYCAKKNKVSKNTPVRTTYTYRNVLVGVQSSGKKAAVNKAFRLAKVIKANNRKEKGLLIQITARQVKRLFEAVKRLDVVGRVKEMLLPYEYLFRPVSDIKFERTEKEFNKIFGGN